MDDFLCGLTGDIVTPFEPIYNEARQGFNRAVQQYPLIIVYCKNKRDVSNAVIWSRKHRVPIRIRNGGHNYEGYSNGDCTLVIDTSALNSMCIDDCNNRLYVEAGVNNKQVYEFVTSKGYPFPGGTCPTVGVSGYVLGGGWGLSCRYLGLGCDNLEEIEIVDYEGTVLKANCFINPDLFWACRGAGGGNYGVVVSMCFRLPRPVNKVTLIEIDYRKVSSEEQEKFLQTWQEWLNTADERMTLISRIYNSVHDELAMLVRGIFYGEPDEAKEMLADFLELKEAVYNFEYLTFLEAVTIIGGVYPPFEKFQAVSRFAVRNLSSSEISELTGLIKERPQGSVFTGLSLYALGGRVAETGTNDTAFYYRRAKYILWLETIWEENRYARENREWIDDQFPYLESATTGSYINFPYGRLPDYRMEYYGEHADSLIKIKLKYDPKNIFSFPQGLIETQNHFSPIASDLSEKDEKELPEQSDDAIYRGFRYIS